MSNFWCQTISIIGAAVGLWAFILLQLEKPGWGAKDSKYLTLCVIAGSLLSWAAIVQQNIGFVVLNVVFTLFAIWGIGQRIKSSIWKL